MLLCCWLWKEWEWGLNQLGPKEQNLHLGLFNRITDELHKFFCVTRYVLFFSHRLCVLRRTLLWGEPASMLAASPRKWVDPAPLFIFNTKNVRVCIYIFGTSNAEILFYKTVTIKGMVTFVVHIILYAYWADLLAHSLNQHRDEVFVHIPWPLDIVHVGIQMLSWTSEIPWSETRYPACIEHYTEVSCFHLSHLGWFSEPWSRLDATEIVPMEAISLP